MVPRVFVPVLILLCSFSDLRAQESQDYMLGDSLVRLEFRNSGNSNRILFINVHENEFTSVQAVTSYDVDNQYAFLKLVHRGTRRVFFNYENRLVSIDPNRIFSRDGIEATLGVDSLKSHRAERMVRLFAHTILDYLAGFDWIISLHNNTPNDYSILSYQPGGDEQTNAVATCISDQLDPDDFIFTTSEELYHKLAANGGVNCALQNNRHCVDDGSLSVYCGKHGINYANVEAEEGHLQEQIQLISVLLAAIEQ